MYAARAVCSKIILTSVLLLQMPFAQQNQANFERKNSNLTGSLAENDKTPYRHLNILFTLFPIY